jgi:hypothetical protein
MSNLEVSSLLLRFDISCPIFDIGLTALSGSQIKPPALPELHDFHGSRLSAFSATPPAEDISFPLASPISRQWALILTASV